MRAMVVGAAALALGACSLRASDIDCGNGWSCPSGSRCAPDPTADLHCISATCGDGVIGPLEDCDGDLLGSGSCTMFGYYGGTLSCDPITCRYQTKGCSGRCGDGAVEAGEACDGSVSISCADLPARYDAGPLVCTPQCTLDTSKCTFFGFDTLYTGSAAIGGFCGYQTPPAGPTVRIAQDVSAYDIDATGSATALPGTTPYTMTSVACNANTTAALGIGAALYSYDGSAWDSPEPDGYWESAVPVGSDAVAAVAQGENAGAYGGVGYGATIAYTTGTGWALDDALAPTVANFFGHPALALDPDYPSAGAGGFVAGAGGAVAQRQPDGTWAMMTSPFASTEYVHWLWSLGGGDVLAASDTRVLQYSAASGRWSYEPAPPGPMGGSDRANIFVSATTGELWGFDGMEWSKATASPGPGDGLWVAPDGGVYLSTGPELLDAHRIWMQRRSQLSAGAMRGLALATVSGHPTLIDVATQDGYAYLLIDDALTYVGQFGLVAGDAVDNIVFAVGGTTLARSALSPQLVPTTTTATIASVDFFGVLAIDDDHALAVGQGGAIYAYNTGTWGSVFTATNTAPTQNDLEGIGGGPGDFLAVGDHGTILGSPDGVTWTAIDPGLSLDVTLRAVAVVQGTAYVVGDGGTILQRQNGAWKQMPSTTTHDLLAVGGSGSDLFATGDRVILTYDGTQWSGIRPPTTGASYGDVIVTPRRVYVPGYVLYRAD